jgi:hypothetical protein
MIRPTKITFYYLPVSPPPSEFCGVDEEGTLYFHPAAISIQLLHKATRARATVFVRIPAGIVPLVSFDWAEEVVEDDQLDLLGVLKSTFRGFIKAAAQAHHYSLADVSFSGDPAFTDALLRAMAGTDN